MQADQWHGWLGLSTGRDLEKEARLENRMPAEAELEGTRNPGAVGVGTKMGGLRL